MTTVNVTLTPGVDTDQTSSLQAQVSAAPNGTALDPTVINLPAGRYRIDGGITLSSRSHIRLTCLAGVQTYPARPADTQAFFAYTDNAGYTAAAPRVHFKLTGCTDVEGSFLAIDGPNIARTGAYATYKSTWEAGHAFAVTGRSTDCGFEDCWYTSVYGDGCYVGQAAAAASSETNWNSFFRRISGRYAGRHCLTIVSGNGVEFTDIDMDLSGFNGVDFEPNGFFDVVRNVTATRCKWGGRLRTITCTAGSLTHDVPGQLKFANFTFTDCESLHPTSASGNVLSCSNGSGALVLDGLIDHRNNEYVLMTIGIWPSITVQNCQLDLVTGGGHAVVPSYGLRTGTTGTLVMLNNTFGGPITKPVKNLADLTSSPSSYVHYGNTWWAGTQNDGLAPSEYDGAIAQTMPAMVADCTGTSATILPPGAVEASFLSGLLGSVNALYGLIELGAVEQQLNAVLSIAQTLPALVQFAEVHQVLEGSFAQTLPALTQHAVAGVAPHSSIVGDIDSVLPSLTQQGVSSTGIAGAIAQTLPSLTQTVTSSLPAEGTIVQTLPALTQAMRVGGDRWDEWLVSLGDEWVMDTSEEWLVRH